MFILRESEIEKIVNFFYLMFTIYCTIRKILIRIRSNIKSSIRIWIKSFSPHLSRPLSSDYTVLYRGRDYLFSKFSITRFFSPCLVMHIAFACSKQQNWVRFELHICSFPNKTTDNETASRGVQNCHLFGTKVSFYPEEIWPAKRYSLYFRGK